MSRFMIIFLNSLLLYNRRIVVRFTMTAICSLTSVWASSISISCCHLLPLSVFPLIRTSPFPFGRSRDVSRGSGSRLPEMDKGICPGSSCAKRGTACLRRCCERGLPGTAGFFMTVATCTFSAVTVASDGSCFMLLAADESCSGGLWCLLWIAVLLCSTCPPVPR